MVEEGVVTLHEWYIQRALFLDFMEFEGDGSDAS